MVRRKSRAPAQALALALRRRRDALGITQRVLAARVGTQQSTISELESGLHDVTVGLLADVGAALGLRLTWEEVP